MLKKEGTSNITEVFCYRSKGRNAGIYWGYIGFDARKSKTDKGKSD